VSVLRKEPQRERSRDSEDHLVPGARVREYEIVRFIASGGFGDVYEAHHPVLARRVALKILQACHADDAELARQFLAEGRILAQIRSPHVVAVYDADTHERRAWIAMELLEGRTLRELLLERKRLPLARALEIASSVASGAGALHGRNVVHRDLKPENVFVTNEGRVIVMDLGIAKVMTASGESSASQVLGTARYMSPEQIQRVTTGIDVDARSDVYALSLMLYEMLSGQHPFDGPGTTLDALLLRQINLPAPSLAERAPWVPAAVRALVEKGLEKKRERRHPSMEVFSSEIAAALPGASGDRSSGRSVRGFGWVALMALVVVLGGTAAALVLFPSRRAARAARSREERAVVPPAPPAIPVGAAFPGVGRGSSSPRVPTPGPAPATVATPPSSSPSRPSGRPEPGPAVGSDPGSARTAPTGPPSASRGAPLLLPNEEDGKERPLGGSSRPLSTSRPPVSAPPVRNRPVVL
jgi:serine/threonine protein kinase